MENDIVLLKKEGKIATITFNRPEASNALSVPIYDKVIALLKECEADEEVNVVVFTGTGKHFSAGGDIRGFKLAIEEKRGINIEIVRKAAEMIKTIRRFPKPTVAMVNGAAAGAGCSTALACDFRVAAPSTKFVMAFVNMGFSGDTGGLYNLQRIVGLARATEMMMTGLPVKGEEAYRIGLANLLAEEGKLEETAYGFAQTLASKPGFALRKQKELISEFFLADFDAYLEKEAQFMSASGNTQDYVEAVNAFLEKRTPHFIGK